MHCTAQCVAPPPRLLPGQPPLYRRKSQEWTRIRSCPVARLVTLSTRRRGEFLPPRFTDDGLTCELAFERSSKYSTKVRQRRYGKGPGNHKCSHPRRNSGPQTEWYEAR